MHVVRPTTKWTLFLHINLIFLAKRIKKMKQSNETYSL